MKKFSVYLKTLLVCIILSVVLLAVFIISLTASNKPVSQTPQKVPYYSSSAPSEYGALICFREGGSIFLEFNYDSEKTFVLLLGNSATGDEVTSRGYDLDVILEADYSFLAELIDRFGGILLNTESDGLLNFTGVQITELLSKSSDMEFRRRVAERLLGQIYKEGFTLDDIMFLLENTQSPLSYPSAYFLNETISAATKQTVFIN